MKLYGKFDIKQQLDDIAAQNRLPHAILFSGNMGSGRKTLARYTSQLFLCKNNACGTCATCRNIESNTHPDVIFVKAKFEGKYSVKLVREILGDAVIRPNNGEIKIYIFEDCDSMNIECYNALLKIIEEPPDYLRFIFTCENTGLIPETVMSRVTEFEVCDTPIKDCEQALCDSGVANSKAKELAEMFAGNIGKCREVLDGGNEVKLIEAACRAANALGKRNGFELCRALSEQTGRAEFRRVMEYLSRMIRDALAIQCGESAEFFGKKESKIIAESYSPQELVNMLDVVFEIAKNEIYYLNTQLSATYFISRINFVKQNIG